MSHERPKQRRGVQTDVQLGKLAEQFVTLWRASFQACLVVTPEPKQAMHAAVEAARHLTDAAEETVALEWRFGSGFRTIGIEDGAEQFQTPSAQSNPELAELQADPAAAILAVARLEEIMPDLPPGAIILFRDFGDFWRNPMVRAAFSYVVEYNLAVHDDARRLMVFVQPTSQSHPSVEHYLHLVEHPLPEAHTLEATIGTISADGKAFFSDPAERARIAESMLGLTLFEAENLACYAIEEQMSHGRPVDETIEREKCRILNELPGLTYVPRSQVEDPELLQGYDRLVDFVKRAAVAYEPWARELNLDRPKGLVLVGLPGTGKSLAGRVLAKILQRPLVRLDVEGLFGQYVGQTESNLERVLKTVETIGGCVLLIDEADKRLSGMADSRGDSGVGARVFGRLLTWLQEKRDGSFVVCTMNRTKNIPPEFFRPGRFDAVFGVIEPDEQTRIAIIRAHLRKRGCDPDELGFSEKDWQSIARKTQDLVGGDLEQIVIESRRLAAQARGKEGRAIPTVEELLHATEDVRARVRRQRSAKQFQEMREWILTNTQLVSGDPPEMTPQARRRGVR